jgi:hypothetical protein
MRMSAETVKQLTTLGPYALCRILEVSGYTGQSFKTALFEGIGDSGDFVYKVTFHDDSGLGEDSGKVYVHYDPAANKVSADF